MEPIFHPAETPVYLTLVDEDGAETEFELLGDLEADGAEYRALLPHFDDPAQALQADGQFVILRVQPDDSGEDTLATIDDEEEYDRIGALFLQFLEEDGDGEPAE